MFRPKAGKAAAVLTKKAKNLAKKAAAVILPEKNSRVTLERRAARSPAAEYHSQYIKVWNWVFISLPFDFLLFLSARRIPIQPFDPVIIETALVISLFLALVSLFRQEMFAGSLLFRFFRDRFLLRSRRAALWILAFIVIAMTFIDVYFRSQGAGIPAVILPLLAAVAAVFPALGTMKERLHRLHRKSRNRLIWLEELDRQRYIFTLAPLVPARLISPAAAVSTPDFLPFAVCWITSLLMLFVLEPRESDFFILCRKCLRKTSRSLAGMRYCPGCARVVFYIPEVIDRKER